ncbi:MAG: DUF4062 domain-containing protein [Methanotrichaceae archaeon]|nr:DUF4062 domain-containing protein [Methanotrichaceae archaeon]
MVTESKVKIFLSSTFIDLVKVRSDVSQWLTSVFGADLIIMETIGSDTAPPDINSVRRVRECDFFVGIYAYRYGTIDQISGKSITELELDEAKNAFSSGSLSEILLYVTDTNASWPIELRETDRVAQAGLQRLREKAKQHSVTYFKDEYELLKYIIRDVNVKLSEHFSKVSTKLRRLILPARKILFRPVGMEFIASEYRDYLIGREKDVKKLFPLLDDNPIVLLLGDSGVGKTSLIHAGLIPKIIERGFRPIYTRPLGLPCTDITRQIQTTIFESGTAYRGPLVPLLAEISTALRKRRVLVIIDQFEDVLAARENRETDELVSELRRIRELLIPTLRMLISYRADLEGRLGEYWQKISGSPNGLPRVYLSGITKDEAWVGVRKAAQDLSIDIEVRPSEQKRIKNDLVVSSHALGLPDVYPPYIQMLMDHIWSSAERANGAYRISNYQQAGGMEGVIGGYLNRQLGYAHDKEGHVQAVLVSLVRSYGVKTQRSIDEIVTDTALDKLQCDVALEKLIDLRLVRHIDPYYEISHDFIAKRIISELVDSEEREFKRFRELLTSKAAAYKTTKASLTSEELLMIYKWKERVIPNDMELQLLLSSWLQREGPGLYWLLHVKPSKVLEWLRAEESKEDIDQDRKVSIILLRKKLGEKPLADEDYFAFHGYQLSAEMAALILEDPLSLPTKLVSYGLHHRREEVRDACKNAVVLKVKHGDWSWIVQFRKSNSAIYREAYVSLVLAEDVLAPNEKIPKSKFAEEFSLLKKIASTSNSSEAKSLLKMLQKKHPPVWISVFGEALTYLRQGRMTNVIRKSIRASREKAEILLAAIDGETDPDDFDALMSAYEDFNVKEKGRYETKVIYAKANGLAHSISRSMPRAHLPRLRQAMKKIRLTASSRQLVHALLEYGNLSDFKLILSRIGAQEQEIDFWNHSQLAQTVAKRMERIAKRIPGFLRKLVGRKEFWEYVSNDDRPKLPRTDLLPLRLSENRRLFIRLAAYGMIGAATKEDKELLTKLATHNYGLIARAAAIRLVRLLGDKALRELSAKVEESIQKGESKSLADALRSAEIEFFSVASLW